MEEVRCFVYFVIQTGRDRVCNGCCLFVLYHSQLSCGVHSEFSSKPISRRVNARLPLIEANSAALCGFRCTSIKHRQPSFHGIGCVQPGKRKGKKEHYSTPQCAEIVRYSELVCHTIHNMTWTSSGHCEQVCRRITNVSHNHTKTTRFWLYKEGIRTSHQHRSCRMEASSGVLFVLLFPAPMDSLVSLKEWNLKVNF